jgi:hypothetical protein
MVLTLELIPGSKISAMSNAITARRRPMPDSARSKVSLKALFLVAWAASAAAAAEMDDGGSPGAGRAAAVDDRGDHAMGFSHGQTAHHFALTANGGRITAAVRRPEDDASRAAIVRHFHHIASAFKQGDFEMPMFIHDRTPPGVPAMKRLAREIEYRVEETSAGATVVVTTSNREALEAIHSFLRYQIEDHRTGDSTAIQP